MYLKKLAAGFAVGVCFVPVLASAQENQPTEGAYCPHLTRDLKFRDRDATTGGEVTELQKFLADYYDLNPDDYVTGYFGRLTKQNVIRFQREQNLPAYGYVGPLTRARIARMCGVQTTTQPTVGCKVQCSTGCIDATQPDDWTCPQSLRPGDGCYEQASVCERQVNGQCGWRQTTALAQCLATASVPIPSTQGNQPCIFNNQTIPHGSSVTAYQSPSVPAGQTCQSQTRTCTNGSLSGSYQYATCSVATATCTPEAPQTQTPSCPGGQTGSITQTRTSSCPGPTWGAWTTTSNTCTTPPPPPPTNVGACTYKGQTYAEDATVQYGPVTITCDNATWVFASMDMCDNSGIPASARSDLNCGPYVTKAPLDVVSKRHGRAPHTVTVRTVPMGGFCDLRPYKIYWGDGSEDIVSGYQYCDTRQTNSHTYQSPDSYVISYTDLSGYSNSARIRVDGPTASANKSSQLASALASLESALKAILQLLGQ